MCYLLCLQFLKHLVLCCRLSIHRLLCNLTLSMIVRLEINVTVQTMKGAFDLISTQSLFCWLIVQSPLHICSAVQTVASPSPDTPAEFVSDYRWINIK